MSHKSIEAGKEAAETMSGIAHDQESVQAFAEGLLTNHPTHQQAIMGAMMTAIIQYAENPFTDGRNQASKEMARKLAKIIRTEGNVIPHSKKEFGIVTDTSDHVGFPFV